MSRMGGFGERKCRKVLCEQGLFTIEIKAKHKRCRFIIDYNIYAIVENVSGK